MLNKLIVLILLIISIIVSAGLALEHNMWRRIVIYWTALVFKNLHDLIFRKKGD